jgi:hypothetical protein
MLIYPSPIGQQASHGKCTDRGVLAAPMAHDDLSSGVRLEQRMGAV